MRGVVAVFHEHPGEVSKLQRDRDIAAWAQPPDVLPALLLRRDIARLAVTGEGLALLEVDVDGVIPAAAVIFQVPDLARAEFRRRRDPAEVRGEKEALVRRDAPRAFARRDGVPAPLDGIPAELESPLADYRNLGQIRVRDQGGRHLTFVGIGRVASNAELQELADAGIQ